MANLIVTKVWWKSRPAASWCYFIKHISLYLLWLRPFTFVWWSVICWWSCLTVFYFIVFKRCCILSSLLLRKIYLHILIGYFHLFTIDSVWNVLVWPVKFLPPYKKKNYSLLAATSLKQGFASLLTLSVALNFFLYWSGCWLHCH